MLFMDNPIYVKMLSIQKLNIICFLLHYQPNSTWFVLHIKSFSVTLYLLAFDYFDKKLKFM